MRKIFILLVLLIICTGCMRIDNIENYDAIVNTIIDSKVRFNTTSKGYKYYVPIGVTKVSDKDYNQKFKYEDNYIYLYVDVVSYYYQNTLNFTIQDKGIYYNKISNGNKAGYITIEDNKDGTYYIKIIYNYAKIESTVKKSDINKVLTNSMIIINSIEYNNNLIKDLLEEENTISSTKEYKIDKPKDAVSKFSEYLSEYVAEEESTVDDLPDY